MAGAGVIAAAGYGRFAAAEEFEQHVAELLGAPLEVATSLTQRARERLGDPGYDFRASAFLTATTFPGDTFLPKAVRERAIEPFVLALINDSIENLIYLGVQPPVEGTTCVGLLPA